jgi:hypothetical protein
MSTHICISFMLSIMSFHKNSTLVYKNQIIQIDHKINKTANKNQITCTKRV